MTKCWAGFATVGVVITHNLSWSEHIVSKVSPANQMLGLIKRTCGKRPIPKVFLNLYIHLVRPHQDYACEVWSPHHAYLVDILEGVQGRATKVVVKNKPYCERNLSYYPSFLGGNTLTSFFYSNVDWVYVII